MESGAGQKIREEKKVELCAEEISFRYEIGGTELFHQVSVSIASGERVGLCAPSGFGKTTLCRILAGYEAPDAGRVLFDGSPLSAWKGKKVPVQLLWQHPEQAVNPRRKMKQVLWEGGYGLSHKNGSASLSCGETLLTRLGIRPEWLDRYPQELSGGELQRFCLARALGAGTEILLADESTAMFDLVTEKAIWRVVLEEAERRSMGLLIVTHSERLLRQLCTRRLPPETLRHRRVET